MHPINDHIIIQVPKRHDDELTVGGQTLYRSTIYDDVPTVTAAKVLAGPQSVSDLPIEGYSQFRYSAIRHLPRAGDTVFVKWTALSRTRMMEENVYSINLTHIVATPDGCGGYLGFADYLLCEPLFPEATVDVGGVPVEGTMTASGLLIVSSLPAAGTQEGDSGNIGQDIPKRNGVPAIKGQALVRYTGTPLKGQADEVRAYDIVAFDKKGMSSKNGYPLMLRIEGKEFFVIRRAYVAAVLERPSPLLNQNHLYLPVEEETKQAA